MPGILSDEVRLAQSKKLKEHHAVFDVRSRDEPTRMKLEKAGVHTVSVERWERIRVLQQGCAARHLTPIPQTLESLTSSRRGSRQPGSVQYLQHGVQISSSWSTDVNTKTAYFFTPHEGID